MSTSHGKKLILPTFRLVLRPNEAKSWETSVYYALSISTLPCVIEKFLC